MRIHSPLIAAFAAAAFTVGLAGCDVEKTKEGNVNLPEYEVAKKKEGDVTLPEYKVTTPDVTVTKKEVEVPVPKVETEKKAVTVPDIDVKTADEKKAEEAKKKAGSTSGG